MVVQGVTTAVVVTPSAVRGTHLKRGVSNADRRWRSKKGEPTGFDLLGRPFEDHLFDRRPKPTFPPFDPVQPSGFGPFVPIWA